MSTPMWDVPDHLLIPVDELGRGPVAEDEAVRWACWCGGDNCGENPSDGGGPS